MGDTIDTPIRCRRRPDHRPCPGYIWVRRSTEDDHIRRNCSGCNDNGLISGRRETAWDYSTAVFEEP